MSSTTERIRRKLELAYWAQAKLCYYCKGEMLNPAFNGVLSDGFTIPEDACTADHVMPMGAGGKMAGMIVAACRKCNTSKGSDPDWEYEE